jgi:dUTP pyrophosphatase
MSSIKYVKFVNHAISPTKRIEDAGYDLYCNSEISLLIKPGEIVNLPTGLGFKFNNNMVGIVKERGSTGSMGLSIRMGIIDSGYRGEVFVGLNNTSGRNIHLSVDIDSIIINPEEIYYPMSKAIAQILFLSLPVHEMENIGMDEFTSYKSERMGGSLGSTNK